MPRRYFFKTTVVLLVIVILLVVIHLITSSFSTSPPWITFGLPHAEDPASAKLGVLDPDAPPCERLSGAEDVVVVMRTGATEIKDKLPVHLDTTFRCYENTLIFSDYEEVFKGHQVYDVLASLGDELKRKNDDFKHYLRLQRLGREGLADDELHGESWESGPVGKNDNPGWRLDKWKFLPMMVETLKLRPNRKWYIFVEPDSYMIWSNMLQWLRKLDPSKAVYYGSEVQIGDDIFAHGGSVFVMSCSAIQKAINIYLSNQDEWHRRTAEHWAGDCILGTALKHAGVDLTWSWPMFQGGNPADMNWLEEKGGNILWCVPALSYHHFTSSEVKALWDFEQQQIAGQLSNGRLNQVRVLHHNEVYKTYVVPNISSQRHDWSNASPDIIPNSLGLTIDACRAICVAKPECMQFALGQAGCVISEDVHMGSAAMGVESGWINERVDGWLEKLERTVNCRGRSSWTAT
ncbi:glycosyltransferase family 31 protein [Acidomyces richmondensis BFW]|nr:MAG: glycosyltransferase family 31 protein [Acidomyces sp. 'richmondensis']KYG44040.1 glycosyltransferase family 31 protein [Acidomyces richmondensis BFW]